MKLGEGQPKSIQKALARALGALQMRAAEGSLYHCQANVRGVLRATGHGGLAEYVMLLLSSEGLIEAVSKEMPFAARMWRLTPAGVAWQPDEGGAR